MILERPYQNRPTTRNVNPNILRKKNMNQLCSNYLLLLQLYNINKATTNPKTAKLPAAYYKAHPVTVKQEYKISVLHQTLLLLLHIKTSLFKTVRQGFGFFIN